MIEVILKPLAEAAVKKTAGQGIKTLRDLMGMQEESLALLRSLNVKVDYLLRGPFETGRLQMRDALAPHRDAADQQRLLLEARSSFTASLGQDPEPFRRSVTALHLAALWVALDSRPDVRRSITTAHVEGLRAVYQDWQHARSGLREFREITGRNLELYGAGGSDLKADSDARRYCNPIAETARAWGSPPSSAPFFVLVTPKLTRFYWDPRGTRDLNAMRWTLLYLYGGTWARSLNKSEHRYKARDTWRSQNRFPTLDSLASDQPELYRQSFEELNAGGLIEIYNLDDWLKQVGTQLLT